MSAGEFPIEPLAEALQVDICGIHEVKEGRLRGRGDVSRRDGDRLNPPLSAFAGRIHGIFRPNDWIVIGERNALRAMVHGGQGDVFRTGGVTMVIDLP